MYNKNLISMSIYITNNYTCDYIALTLINHR